MPVPVAACRAAALAPVLVLLAAAAPARAVPIPSDPLTVHVGDRGQLQALRTGETGGLFFPPGSPTGDAGFFLAFPAGAAAPPPPEVAGVVAGFQPRGGPAAVAEFTPGAQSPVTGAGTAADPFEQRTFYGVPGVAAVIQTTRLVAGDVAFTVEWEVRNVSAGPLAFKALAAGDLHVQGSDAGTGVFTDVPRFAGATNPATGLSAGFAERTRGLEEPWSHYAVLPYGTTDTGSVWASVGAAAASPAPTLADTLLAEPEDAAVAIEWDGRLLVPLQPGTAARFALTVHSATATTFQVAPPATTGAQGTPLPFAAAARDALGAPLPGRTVGWRIAGANPGAGTATTDAAGIAAIPDPAAVAGADTVVAFLDADGDGVRGAAEPQAAAVGTVVDRTPPSCSVRLGARARGPLRAVVRCDERVRLTARATLATRSRRVRLPSVTRPLTSGRLRFPLPRAVRAVLGARRTVATLAVTASDAAGNRVRATAIRRFRPAR